MNFILSVVVVFLAITGVLATGWHTLLKFRAKHDLASSIQQNAADVVEVNRRLKANDVEAAIAVLRKHLAKLSPAERREAETALAQPSVSGRVGYIRGVLGPDAL